MSTPVPADHEAEAVKAAAKAIHDLIWRSGSRDLCGEAVAHEDAMREAYAQAEAALAAARPHLAAAERAKLVQEQASGEFIGQREQAAINRAYAEGASAEKKRIATVMRKGFDVLDNDTKAVLAAMMARWAAAMTDDPEVLGGIAGLFDAEHQDGPTSPGSQT